MAKENSKGKFTSVQIVVLIVAVVAVLGIAYAAVSASAAPTTVANGDNVSVLYTGSLTNGTVFNSNFGGKPFIFTVGANQVIQGFNQAVIGMMVNQTKNVTIPANEAYGPVSPSLFVSVPRSVFGNQTVYIGETVTSSSGTRGIITALNAINATIDLNPPLAGQTLLFEIKIVAIGKASASTAT